VKSELKAIKSQSKEQKIEGHTFFKETIKTFLNLFNYNLIWGDSLDCLISI